jgi:hypothetical protein
LIGAWIWIHIGNADQDPNPEEVKIAKMKEETKPKAEISSQNVPVSKKIKSAY